LEHLREDFERNTPETDLSHLEEVLALHDLSRDVAAGTPNQFKERCAKKCRASGGASSRFRTGNGSPIGHGGRLFHCAPGCSGSSYHHFGAQIPSERIAGVPVNVLGLIITSKIELKEL
jgi:hypothetical protein